MTRFSQFLYDIAAAFRRLFKQKPERTPRPTDPTEPRTLIIAYSHDAAWEYAQDNGLIPQEWRCASRPEDLYGFRNVKIVRLAGWRNRKDEHFMNALRRLEATNHL